MVITNHTKEPVVLRAQNLQTDIFGPVDLELKAGEILMISGASGSGKTRLLRALADLDPHRGQVSLNGLDQQAMAAPKWRSRVAFLAADSAWWFDSVGEHFPSDGSIDWPSVGFDADVRHWQLARLSSGEKQRLALLRLLLNQPQVLLLDEPSANLDPANEQRVEQLIKDYVHGHQAAAVWVSHDPQQIQRVATRQRYMQQGRLEAA